MHVPFQGLSQLPDSLQDPCVAITGTDSSPLWYPESNLEDLVLPC